MLKNKLKIIALLTLLMLALTLPIVRAEDENADETSLPEVTSPGMETPDESASEDEIVTATTEENFKRSDVYLNGDNITIDYIIDGNVFIVANTVTINSQIGGDAFICANSVIVEEQGYVFSNLFTLAKNVTINGVVYDLYSASQNTTINGYVYRDVHIGSNDVNILGTIGRNAYIGCDTLNFTQDANTENGEETTPAIQATINGNLEYSSKEEISIPEGSVIGDVTFEQKASFGTIGAQSKIMKLGTFVATVIVVWLVCLWLAPKFLKKNTDLLTTKKILPVIGFGILAPIVIVLLTILCFVLGITSTLGLLLILTFVILIIISNSMFIMTLNNMICNKLKIEKTLGIFGMLIVTSIVLWLIGLIPIVGFILGTIVVILGLGINISSLVLKDKEEVKE